MEFIIFHHEPNLSTSRSPDLLFSTSGKPPTRLPLEELVEQVLTSLLAAKHENHRECFIQVHHDELLRNYSSSQNEDTDTRGGSFESLGSYLSCPSSTANSKRRIASTSRSKVARPYICMDAALGQYNPHRYVQPAVNQPGYRRGNS